MYGFECRRRVSISVERSRDISADARLPNDVHARPTTNLPRRGGKGERNGRGEREVSVIDTGGVRRRTGLAERGGVGASRVERQDNSGYAARVLANEEVQKIETYWLE
jgi:hypothetical protein